MPLPQRFKLFLVVCAALVPALVSVEAQISEVPDIPEASDRVKIDETFTNGFRHPGIGLTRDMLENARRQVLAGKEPWYSGFHALAAHPLSAKTVTCRNQSAQDPTKPDLDAFDAKRVESRLKQDAYKAKQQALMYYFTGDEVYRANAMNIVRVWSRMNPRKYRSYDEAYIHASYPVQDLIMAAELLRYTSSPNPKLAWTEKDTRDFTGNFVVPAVDTFLNENSWFMNQNGYPLAAAMSGDIFRSDRGAYAKRVEWFTVNKDAPNKGWSSSITHLARLVDTNAITGEKAAAPVVQLMEMGRDQAHAGDDVEIFMNTSRQMNAQGTKVDPVTGVLSTAENAVGPYEFLGDRILAAADGFCRFMLGHDTPWIPAPYDIGPGGEVRGIYPRIADNYRGRIRGLDCWDAYYYYAGKGVDLAKKAPYYHEAFTKRIVASLTDWIYIPAGVSGEAARVAPTELQPAVVEIARRSTQFDDKAVVMKEEGGTAFVRVVPAATGTRIAILSSATDKKTIGLRIRTTGVAEVAMSGLAKPWLLPDTRGEWRQVTYTMGKFERFPDIVYFSVKGSSDIRVDFDSLLRDMPETPAPLAFKAGSDDLSFVAYVGAPIALYFSPAAASEGAVAITGLDLPGDALLNRQTGAFLWRPSGEGEHAFVVTLDDGKSSAAKRVRIVVTADRESAVRRIASVHDKNTDYVASSLEKCRIAFAEINARMRGDDDQAFFARLVRLQQAFGALEPLTPRLPDGSMDYPKIVASSTIGASIALLVDGNDDTFPIASLAKSMNYVFDFGPGYQISASAFALEGRLNFENRTQDTAFFGSNDGKKWTQLTMPLASLPTELTRIEVKPEYAGTRFRYLKIEKMDKESAGLFEPSELRIYGQRSELK